MQNIKITISGLEGIAAAVDRLAGAIEAQKAIVVPVEEEENLKTPDPTATAEVSAASEEIETPAPTVSLDQVRAKFVEIAQKGKREELKDLLQEFNADNVSGLKAEVLAEVYARLEEM